jgi:hypothetical protein
MPHTRDQRGMAVLSEPVDCLLLCLEGWEHVVRVVLHHKIFKRASLGALGGAAT